MSNQVSQATNSIQPKRTNIAVVGSIVSFLLGILYAWSVFLPATMQALEVSRAELSWVFSFMMCFFGLGMFCGGFSIQKIGPRNTAITGGILLGLGFILTSFAQSVGWIVFSYGVIAGFGVGLANIVPVAVALRWYPDKKGLISGILTMALALGTPFTGALLAPWLLKAVGWSQTFLYLGIIFLVTVPLASLTFKLPPAEYKPTGWKPPEGSEGLWGYDLKGMLATPSYWLGWLWVLCIQCGGLMLIGNMVLLVSDKLSSPAYNFTAFLALGLGSAGGRFFHGWVWDRFGRKTAMAADAIICGAGLTIILISSTPLLFFLGFIMVCAAYGGVIPQLAALVSSFYGPKNFGTNYGFSVSPSVAAAFLGTPLGAYLYHTSYNAKLTAGIAENAIDKAACWDTALIIAAVLTIISLLIAFILKEPENKPL